MATDAGRYKVVYLEAVRSFLKQCSAKAVQHNAGQEILNALESLDESLAKDPLSYGDPWRHLGTLKIFHRLKPPFDIVYGVHLQKRVVFVREMRLFPAERFD
ncbi:MAG: hypothetical protein L0Y72_10640 [Gemmataceae bacterium]|nr:hypothetical protein [Gemmataceae bacterium]MCI0739491.1 hypothetical protein [Gemmataceae bacterium]